MCSNSVMSDSLRPYGLQPARLLCPWGFYRQEYRSWLPCPPSGDLLHPGIEPRSPALQVDSFLCDAPGKPKNTGVGSMSLLQGIFLTTQESNWGLLHCWWILYQLSYQGSPVNLLPVAYVANNIFPVCHLIFFMLVFVFVSMLQILFKFGEESLHLWLQDFLSS